MDKCKLFKLTTVFNLPELMSSRSRCLALVYCNPNLKPSLDVCGHFVRRNPALAIYSMHMLRLQLPCKHVAVRSQGDGTESVALAQSHLVTRCMIEFFSPTRQRHPLVAVMANVSSICSFVSFYYSWISQAINNSPKSTRT